MNLNIRIIILYAIKIVTTINSQETWIQKLAQQFIIN